MRKTIYVLSLLILVLGTWLVVLWLPSFTPQEDDRQETRYGLNEGLELVEQDNGKEGKRYVVEDADGKELFVIPLRNSLLDTRFRNGQLRFREQVTHREGFIDRQGMVTFTHEGFVSIHENNKNLKTTYANTLSEDPSNTSTTYQGTTTTVHEGTSMVRSNKLSNRSKTLSQVDLHTMAQNNPYGTVRSIAP